MSAVTAIDTIRTDSQRRRGVANRGGPLVKVGTIEAPGEYTFTAENLPVCVSRSCRGGRPAQVGGGLRRGCGVEGPEGTTRVRQHLPVVSCRGVGVAWAEGLGVAQRGGYI